MSSIQSLVLRKQEKGVLAKAVFSARNPVCHAQETIRDGETTIKIKYAFLRGGNWGHRGKSSKNAVSLGKRHDNLILKVQILLSIIFVVIAQAPKLSA